MTAMGQARRTGFARIGGPGLATAAGLVAMVAASCASAQEAPAAPVVGKVGLELNKTESQPTGCRVYFVLDNGTADSFDAFKLDLVVFAPDGVILRNLATEMGPLRAEKRMVKMFDLADQPCDGIGSLLVNDVLDCRIGGEPRQDCIDLLVVASRAAAALVK